MKLTQLFENESVFKTMVLKLVKAGEPIFINAKGKTFLAGSNMDGYTAERSTRQGWVIQADDASSTPEECVAKVSRFFDANLFHIIIYKEHAMRSGGFHHRSVFEMEKPLDQHYTLKKIDGVWTVLDRKPVVAEDKKEDGVKKSYLDFKGSRRKKALKAEMKREIARFSKMHHTDPSAYPDDWTADEKYKAELKKKGKKLPKSEHTKEFERRFGK